MGAEQNTNPYVAPLQNGERSVRSAYLPLMIVGSIFLVINLAILAVAQSSLPMLIEFGIELSGVSSLAYCIAKNWYVLIVVLLGFTVGSSFAYSKMKSTQRHLASCFFTFVTLIWLLFTVGFAFGILQPLYVVANVIPGLAT